MSDGKPNQSNVPPEEDSTTTGQKYSTRSEYEITNNVINHDAGGHYTSSIIPHGSTQTETSTSFADAMTGSDTRIDSAKSESKVNNPDGVDLSFSNDDASSESKNDCNANVYSTTIDYAETEAKDVGGLVSAKLSSNTSTSFEHALMTSDPRIDAARSESNVDDPEGIDVSLSNDDAKSESKDDCHTDVGKMGSSAESQQKVFTIKRLHPDMKEWCLHARVFARGDIRHWQNYHGNGKLLEVLLVDGEGSEIRGTFFNEGVDKFQSALQSGHSYAFAGGKVKPAFCSDKKQRSGYEITFTEYSQVDELVDTHSATVLPSINCVSVEHLATLGRDSKASVIGVLVDVGSLKRFRSAAGKDGWKREILLVDDSAKKVICTIWGYRAKDDMVHHIGDPILIRDGRISDYNGIRSLSVGNGATILVTPAMPRTQEISEWYKTTGAELTFELLKSP